MKSICLVLVLLIAIILTLDHSKTFLLQENADTLKSMGVYKNSILYTSSADIVQKNIETGMVERTFRAHTRSVYSLMVVNKTTMISGCWGNLVILWDLERGSVLKRYSLGSTDILLSGLVLRNNLVLTSGLDGVLRKIDLDSERVSMISRQDNIVTCIQAYGDFLFACVRQFPLLRKINILTGATVASLVGHEYPCTTMASYEENIFTGGADKNFLHWNAKTGVLIKEFNNIGIRVDILAVFDGFLYSADRSNAVVKWNIDSGDSVFVLEPPGLAYIKGFAFNSQSFFVGTDYGEIFAFDSLSGNQSSFLKGIEKRLDSIVLWKNFVISGDFSGFLSAWDTSSNEIEPYFKLRTEPSFVSCLSVLNDYLFFTGFDYSVVQWNLSDFSLIKTFKSHQNEIYSLTLNSEDLFSADIDGKIFWWKISSGMMHDEFVWHTAAVYTICLTNDRLFSGGSSQIVATWDLTTLEGSATFDAMFFITEILVVKDLVIVAHGAGMLNFLLASSAVVSQLIEPFTCRTMISDGFKLYCGFSDAKIRARDFQSLAILEIYNGHSDFVSSLVISETLTLYSASFDGSIKVWNMAAKTVAFSFEARTEAVTSLCAIENTLFVGLRSGALVSYNIQTAESVGFNQTHRKGISSLLVLGREIYSAGKDGLVLKMISNASIDKHVIYNNTMASIRGLFITVDYVAFVKSETEILFRKNNGSDYTFQTISAISPIISLTISSSFLLAGSRSGKIFAWSSKSGSFIFELQGHNSAVNDIILDGPTLFSASDDMMIIQWSLEERLAIKVLRRLSATSLGHLGPVNSLIICERALFSGGADLTTRRWNLNTGAHEDVYFGPTKAINSVLCHNQSVFSGSEDFAVYNYFPYFDVQKRSTVDAKISSSKKRRETLRVRLSGQDNQFGVSSDILAIISAAVMIVIITASLFLYYLVWKRKKRNAEPRNHEFTSSDTNSSSFGLTTIVNSSIGISKHAALEIPSSSVASLKKLAAGGGGEVYLATLMDSKMVEKHGPQVVQKIVFIRSKISEEAFFQEVGIMILLSSYPNFCQIIGYTLNPIAMILKYYPTGSLKEWCTNNSYGKNAILKILSEVSGALGTMHNHHIAHCDIKPQNVLIELKEIYPTCFLTDFGITQILSEQVVATKMFHIINQRGVSLFYAAPEAINNFKTKKYARVNYKCYDIYSFACIIYEVSSKKAPWAY